MLKFDMQVYSFVRSRHHRIFADFWCWKSRLWLLFWTFGNELWNIPQHGWQIGSINFQYVNSSNSTCEADFAATGITTTGTTLVKSFIVAANNSLTLTVSKFYVGFREILTIATQTTGNTAKVSANLSWYEDQ